MTTTVTMAVGASQNYKEANDAKRWTYATGCDVYVKYDNDNDSDDNDNDNFI